MSSTHFGFQSVDERDKSRMVRGVFDSVASRYDVMNDLMSAGLHRAWKAYTVMVADVRPGAQVLDIAGGTGDLALACLARGGVWLAGGTAAKLLNELRGPTFQRAFLAKGRLRPVLEPVPIRALLDPGAGSFSAACRARMLIA